MLFASRSSGGSWTEGSDEIEGGRRRRRGRGRGGGDQGREIRGRVQRKRGMKQLRGASRIVFGGESVTLQVISEEGEGKGGRRGRGEIGGKGWRGGEVIMHPEGRKEY